MTDKITIDRATVQQALDALESNDARLDVDRYQVNGMTRGIGRRAIAAVREALAAPQPLPAGCTKVELTAEQEAGLTCRATHIPGVAAPQPVQQTQKMTSNCMECANADSWGLPDKAVCATCEWGSRWTPLNKSSVNPNKVQEAPQPAQEAAIVQHKKPIADAQGVTIGYSEWKDGDGLDWWPHRKFFTAQQTQRQPLFGELIAQHPGLSEELAEIDRAVEAKHGCAALAAPQPAQTAESEGDVQLRACDQSTGREYFIKSGPRAAMQAEADKMNEAGHDYFVLPKLAPQPAQEPVLFIHPATFAMESVHVGAWKPGHELPGYFPLYSTPQAPQPLSLGALAKRRIFDAIRGAYDLGYNDARNARTTPGDSAPGYKGRDVEADHGGALLSALNQQLASGITKGPAA